MKQVLKENGYQERIISKMFKRITYNHSKKKTQAADIREEKIRININVPHVEVASEKYGANSDLTK